MLTADRKNQQQIFLPLSLHFYFLQPTLKSITTFDTLPINCLLSSLLTDHFYIAVETFVQGNKSFRSFNTFYLLQLIM